MLGFSGVLLINSGAEIGVNTLFGDILIFCSTICSTAGNIMSKKFAKNQDPAKITGYQLLIGGLVLVAVGVACGGNLRFENAESVFVLGWLSFVSAAAFTVWTALLKYHPASKISVFNLLVPIFGTLLSGIMLGENAFQIETFASLFLISLGIVAVNFSPKKNKLKNNGEKND